MAIEGYRKLEVWQKAMSVVTAIYAITEKFPAKEQFALTNQIRRAAVSIPSNIAEGKARYNTKDYVRFLLIARGSIAEVETQLLISQNLIYVSELEVAPILNAIAEVGRMINGLINSLSNPKSNNVANT
jgi:four helix bundle protein